MFDTEEDSPLPKVSYDTLKEKQIRDLLMQHGLPTVGDRHTLIKQHQRYITLRSRSSLLTFILFSWVITYNGNLDVAPKRRKTLSQLRSELARWLEKQQKAKPVVEDVGAHQVSKHGMTGYSVFDIVLEIAEIWQGVCTIDGGSPPQEEASDRNSVCRRNECVARLTEAAATAYAGR